MLGLGPDASAEEVRAAFRRLARQHHPDLHPVTERDDALHQMQDITEAKEAQARQQMLTEPRSCRVAGLTTGAVAPVNGCQARL